MGQSASTLDQFRTDLQTYARLAGVPYNPAVTDPVLELLSDDWTSSIVGVRTTTHPQSERDVNTRVIHPGDPSALLAKLREAGLLPRTGHPCEQLVDDICATETVRAGVDLALGSGIQKIWLVFPMVADVDHILGFPGIPESARAHATHLTRYGGQIGILAADFRAHTLNLYSQVLDPGTLTPADIGTILDDLDFAPAPAEELDLLTGTLNVYRTFSWTAPGMQRICFPVRCDAASVPTHLDPLVQRFVAEAPFADPNHPPGFVFYIAFGPDGRYYKIQAEYALGPTVFPGGKAPHRVTATR